ncbi:DHHC palmitoyltransferase-domain-containing protein [Mycena haematopus]|nr:DHHC palmitoyltransferase-domain-containing protein [Mycena haematopus]
MNGTAHNADAKVVLSTPTFCGTITEARLAAREKRERKPQPWAVRKLTVALTLGIMGYAGYVYAGRFAVRLMRDGGGGEEGVGLLCGWAVVYAWMVWAYFKVVLTPPGTASDYIPKSPQPLFQPPTRTQAEWDEYDRQRELDRHADVDSASSFDFQPPPAPMRLADIERGRIGGPVYAIGNAEVPMPTPPPAARRKSSARGRRGRTADQGQPRDEATDGNGAIPNTNTTTNTNGNANISGNGARLPARARTTAPLLPPNRYCARCEIVKPHRAHHCRVCGTCILKYDHHCPWIGQCVGARNHKFFINFLLATVFFTLYTLVSLLVFNTGGRGREGGVDAQEVVLIALAALFLLFTLPLGADHTRMVLSSQTTVRARFACLLLCAKVEADYLGSFPSFSVCCVISNCFPWLRRISFRIEWTECIRHDTTCLAGWLRTDGRTLGAAPSSDDDNDNDNNITPRIARSSPYCPSILPIPSNPSLPTCVSLTRSALPIPPFPLPSPFSPLPFTSFLRLSFYMYQPAVPSPTPYVLR